MNSTRSLSFSSSRTTDACAIPSEDSSVMDLTKSGNRSRAGRRTLRFHGKTAKRGTWMWW